MEVLDVIVNYGVAVGCLVYFMWYNNTTMEKVTSELNAMNQNITKLIERMDE